MMTQTGEAEANLDSEIDSESEKTSLSVYLLHEDVGGPDEYLSFPATWDVRDVKIAGVTAASLLLERREKAASWWSYVSPLLEPLEDQEIKRFSRQVSVGCLLQLTLSGRTFLVAFGTAHLKIKREAQVPDFGFVVTLNLMSPDGVKQLRRKKLKRNTRTILESLRKPTRAEDYGLDLSEDLFRGIDGIPAHPALGKRIGGTSGFRFLTEEGVTALPPLLDLFLTSYLKGVDPELFPWFGKLKKVLPADAAAAGLQQFLVQRLNEYLSGRDIDKDDLQLIFHDEDYVAEYSMEAVRLKGKSLKNGVIVMPRFELSCLVGQFEQNDLTVEDMEDLRLHVDAEGEMATRHLNFERCLYFEHETADSRYLLIDGEWICIDARLFARIDSELHRMIGEKITVDPPSTGEKFKEDDYIKEACRQAARWIEGHHATLKYGGGKSRFEVADLIGVEGDLVALKCYKGNTQSVAHAFVQIRESARVISEEAEVRERFLTALPEPFQANFRQMEVDRGRWRFKLGIITARTLMTLPFSVRQEIVELGRDVQACGFEFEVVAVGP